mgnify:CR=1 FL=1
MDAVTLALPEGFPDFSDKNPVSGKQAIIFIVIAHQVNDFPMIFGECNSIQFCQVLGDGWIPVTCVPQKAFLVSVGVAGHG